MKWEHQIVSLADIGWLFWPKRLDELGKEGWELVCVTKVSDTPTILAVFKRSK